MPTTFPADSPLPNTVKPTGRDAHVWIVRHENPAPRDEAYSVQVLSDNELAGMNRCANEGDRACRMRTRAALRNILGEYLDADPSRLVITNDSHGKPRVDGIEFNCSHARSLTLIAIAAQTIGVDVEPIVAAADIGSIRDRFINDGDLARIATVSGREAAVEMLRLWVIKEACLKAIGCGLAMDPLSVDVRRETESVFRASYRDGEMTIQSIDIPDDHVAYLACGAFGSVNVFEYPNC